MADRVGIAPYVLREDSRGQIGRHVVMDSGLWPSAGPGMTAALLRLSAGGESPLSDRTAFSIATSGVIIRQSDRSGHDRRLK